MKYRKFSINKYNLIFPIVILLAVGVCYAGLLYNKTMPYAEGWYTYYAKCINFGEIPYKDFDFLFPPFFIYLVAFITNIFGYNIIVLRFIGIVFFCAISLLIYFIFAELFPKWIACVSSIVAVLYIQSEAAQVFYDYVRLMDIFSCLTIFLLLKSVKCWSTNVKKSEMYLFYAGISNACFALIKQNMGGIFVCFTFAFIIFCAWCNYNSLKEVIQKMGYYISGLMIPFIAFLLWALFLGCLGDFFGQTGTEALAAKGGFLQILFGWIKNNYEIIINRIPYALIILMILVVIILLSKKFGQEEKETQLNIGSICFGVIVSAAFVICVRSEKVALSLARENYPNAYGIFLIGFAIFLVLGLGLFVCRVKRKKKMLPYMELFLIAGAYFTISYGCGMSGGLAEGQAGIGIALIICLLLDNLKFKYGNVVRIVMLLICLNITLQCGIKKMSHTYNWWGMTSASIWDSTKELDNMGILDSIEVSKKEYHVYQSICNAITENVDEMETIYCFPQIPIFYNLCDRRDPGVRDKVQWFDVCSDASLKHDMDVIQEKQPKAILIYNTLETVYKAHEQGFRNGKVSATRMMREFLYNYVFENGYTFYGNYSAEDNSLSLWIKDTEQEEKNKLFEGGTGTKEDPYLIGTVEQLKLLSYQVNNGRTFLGEYIKQVCDLDFSGETDFIPIGRFDQDCYFYGVYDGAGHVIRNLNISMQGNAGLFGELGGIVCNLGIEGGKINGDCVGVIASHSIGENAAIVNCYTNISTVGTRAGSIADNFAGKVFNVFSVGTLEGTERSGLISYREHDYPMSQVDNSFILEDSVLYSGIVKGVYDNENIAICTKSFMQNSMSQYLNDKIEEVRILNKVSKGRKLSKKEKKIDISLSFEDWMSKIKLVYWENRIEDFPVFHKNS